LVIAPAMESGMWENVATQGHIAALRERGTWIVEPESGYLASGASGVGRLASETQILATLGQAVGPNDLRGLRIVVTAGGTREAIDPVRYISNHSSGRMGYAVAEAAGQRGATVTLISAPVSIDPPVGVRVQQVESAREMERAVLDTLPEADALLMAAAVADYRPAEVAEQKIKKQEEALSIHLTRNPDILLSLKAVKHPSLVVVGWAAETTNLLDYGRDKLRRKKLDLLVANPVPQTFGGDLVQATLIYPEGHEELEAMSKQALAERVLDEVKAIHERR
ncbi:MAG: bifunctional phosphopantothenoylcysteine decarboxylase/phosphopantothenate--cysteine ligase CoaBC, partial [Chloroflexota bacterium]|nr:bifunctional phosphopantothenoylcysteine decarboxylase/phosphopantothenate--cysteine ligase CoaBC [Chloroflexota bacterium]